MYKYGQETIVTPRRFLWLLAINIEWSLCTAYVVFLRTAVNFYA